MGPTCHREKKKKKWSGAREELGSLWACVVRVSAGGENGLGPVWARRLGLPIFLFFSFSVLQTTIAV